MTCDYKPRLKKPIYRLYVYPYNIKEDTWVGGIQMMYDEMDRPCCKQIEETGIIKGGLEKAYAAIIKQYKALDQRGLYERDDKFSLQDKNE